MFGLVRRRSGTPFHGGSTGSNPVGDTEVSRLITGWLNVPVADAGADARPAVRAAFSAGQVALPLTSTSTTGYSIPRPRLATVGINSISIEATYAQ